MLGIACAVGPCCTPILVPILLLLIAGTPLAFWINTHLGWVYAGLTLLSAVSFALAFRWLRSRPAVSKPVLLNPLDIPVITTPKGE